MRNIVRYGLCITLFIPTISLFWFMFIDKIVRPQYVIQFLHSRQDREHFKHIKHIGSVNGNPSSPPIIFLPLYLNSTGQVIKYVYRHIYW